MTKKRTKEKFYVQDNETLSDCLKRMEEQGYVPVQRMEEPIFKEVDKNGHPDIQPCGRKVVFIGQKKTKDEH
ncbi:NETI motif-containing protein [Bacillus carboniphilus]|uniref:NETI motif-containing protein n=1 Tax=Bacillus carboniphilus TaxID=86663 RepID=A0ABY9JUS1_9BACI|nr:NETI motif-containing protein [Bacillus carboniphilus]WLR42238.1 NETI motif-containing protein [Bacillus carboniphilus]